MNNRHAAYTRSKTVRVIDQKIYYYLKNDGQVDVLTYNEELHKILTDRRLSPFRDADGRLRFTLCFDRGAQYKYRIHDLAFACYHGLVKRASIVEDMQRYLNGKVGMEMDHADSNCHNNTVYNLSLMESEENRAKGAITNRVKLPNGIVCACVNGKYRIEFVAATEADYLSELMAAAFIRHAKPGARLSIEHSGTERSIEHYICDTASDFVNCLKRIITTGRSWTDTIKPKGGGYINKDHPCYPDKLDEAIREQERVAALPEEAFQRWQTK